MESVLGRYRNLIILVGVLFLQVLGLATQVKRGNEQEHTRLIRIWVVGAITPFERALVWMENGTSDMWHNYIYLRGVRAENRELKDQIEQMRLEQVRLNEDAAQAHRLQNLLAFKEQYIAKTVAAQVIGTSGTDSSRVIYIDKGEDAGIKRDMGVITADGIVGKVLLSYPSEAQVLLINDQSSGVGVILSDARLQGVLAGTVDGEVVLNDVMSDEQVPVGEKVLTSGGDRIFPKGLPVGTVVKVGKGKDLFLNIKVKPAADLSRLEEVLVLVEKQERQATAEDNTRVRAADILARRLPSVPDKPAEANTNPAAAPGSGKPAVNAAAGNSTLKPAGNSASGLASGSGSGGAPKAASGTTTGVMVAKPAAAATAKASANGVASGPTPLGQAAKATGQVSVGPGSVGAGSAGAGSAANGAAAGSRPKTIPAFKPVPAPGAAAGGPKTTDAAGGTAIRSKPVSVQPKPVKPAPTPATPQSPPADDGSPH
ncbi:MAG TPA: rod shape-determining protein MreC [Terriglobales bacterium]|nr:rod shape-determining protein MreC [Terriglobales bacterium]